MDLLVWENCSKISVIEDYIVNSNNLDKVLIVGVTVRSVQKVCIVFMAPVECCFVLFIVVHV